MEGPTNLQVSDCIMVRRNLYREVGRNRVPPKISRKEDLLEIPPGHLFDPNDDELIKFYLRRKITKMELPVNNINEVPLYDYHPEELTAKFKSERGKKWFFFTKIKRKYPKGHMLSRSAGDGYWKATGSDKTIKDEGKIIGHRKSLDYYVGKHPKGNKTEWKMNEYILNEKNFSTNDAEMNDWVLCKIYQKVSKKETADLENEGVETEENDDLENEANETKYLATDATCDEAPSFPNHVPVIQELVCHQPAATEIVDAETGIGTEEEYEIEIDYDNLYYHQDDKYPFVFGEKQKAKEVLNGLDRIVHSKDDFCGF